MSLLLKSSMGRIEDERRLLVEMKLVFEDTQVLKLRFHLLLDSLGQSHEGNPQLEHFLNSN